MQEGEIELLRQLSRCLMYVGDIPGFQSNQKADSAMTYLKFRAQPPDDAITGLYWSGLCHCDVIGLDTDLLDIQKKWQGRF